MRWATFSGHVVPGETSLRRCAITRIAPKKGRAGRARIIRHRGKIRAAVRNARVTLELRELAASGAPELQGFEVERARASGVEPAGRLLVEPGLPALVWGFKPQVTPLPRDVSEVPTSDAVSAALSKALKKRGIGFIGPTSAYALMEAIGIIDTHPVGAHRRGTSGIYPA